MNLLKAEFQILACPDGEEALALLERIGRDCYQSADKIDDGRDSPDGPRVREPSSYKFVRDTILKQNKTRNLVQKVGMLLEDPTLNTADMLHDLADSVVNLCRHAYLHDPEHESVLEHVNITVRFLTDRGITHELVRHRIASYTMESTRYCNYSKGKFGGGITFIDHDAWKPSLKDVLRNKWVEAVQSAEKYYMELTGLGASPELARGVLPHSTKAALTVTMNLRQWRHVFRMRTSPFAHPQARELLLPLLKEFQARIPIVFDDVL